MARMYSQIWLLDLLWLLGAHESQKLLDIRMEGSNTEWSLANVKDRESDVFTLSNGLKGFSLCTTVQQRHNEKERQPAEI